MGGAQVNAAGGRGYNPGMVNYKESEYHYGSDFEEEDVEEDPESDKTSSSSEEEVEEDSEDLVESDVEFDPAKIDIRLESRPTTPIPFWLRDEKMDELKLPGSSEDLLVPTDLLIQTLSVYEVLRHYSLLLRLSPFRLEDMCCALMAEEQSNLLSEIHICLVRAIIRAEEKDGTHFGPLDTKDSVNCALFFMDSITWPESLKTYLSIDPVLYSQPLRLLEQHPEYPLVRSRDSVTDVRVRMLGCLTDQFLTTNAVRDDIQNEGAQLPEDHCRVCHRLGDMLLCEMCSGPYHLACLDPPLHTVPEDDWQCYVCQANQVKGVTDIKSDQEAQGSLHRHETLGFDRHGNKYWFICRRVVVESLEGRATHYYSSTKQFEELMEALDGDHYEEELVENINNVRDEIESHLQVTETLTNDLKPGYRKSYLDLENGKWKRMPDYYKRH